MTDLTDTRHLHIEFRHEAVKNEAKSRKEGRPIFDDKEMVVIKFVGDRRKELVAPAHEKFTRERASGEWISYAKAFPRHYEAFRNGRDALVEGTPLGEAGFLTKSQVKEFEALNLRTVEQLAAIDGTPLQKLGMYGRDARNKAAKYLEGAKDRALAQENADLRARLAALEAKARGAGAEPAPAAAARESRFYDWPDADLKAFIKDQTGQAPRGMPSHDTLVQMASEAHNKAETA